MFNILGIIFLNLLKDNIVLILLMNYYIYMYLCMIMTCNYNKNLPHIQILSRPNSKNDHFSSSNPITTDYAKSK